MGQQFYDKNHILIALLCLDHAFAKTPVVEGGRVTYTEVIDALRGFSPYLKLLDAIKPDDDLKDIEVYQRLFGLRCTANGLVLPKNTVLPIENPEQAGADDLVVSKLTLRKAVNQFLADRIRTRVIRLIDASHVMGFAPCIDQIVTGSCHRIDDQCHSLHIKPDASQWYTYRIELLMREFYALDQLPQDERLPRDRYCLLDDFKVSCSTVFHRPLIEILYDALNPPFHQLGCEETLTLLDISCAKEGSKAIQASIRNVCQTWTQAGARAAETRDKSAMSSFMRTVAVALVFDRSGASTYLPDFKDSPLPEDRAKGQLISCLQADSSSSILDGVAFLK